MLSLCVASFAEISLNIAGRPASFKEAEVACRLHGRLLIRDLTLTFYNPGRSVAEGDLTCPLDEGEEIVSFSMDVNGIKRKGVVVPKKQAKIAYETIVRRGVDPGLIEVNEVTHEFRTRVFPIPAKGTKTVWIRTVQSVEEGEVRVWPRGLGQPEKWSLALETRGGEYGNFPEQQAGESGAVPLEKLTWRPIAGSSYRCDYGDLSFIERDGDKVALEAETIELWLDGTAQISKAAVDRLSELLGLYQDAEISLHVFRDEVEEEQKFILKGGEAPELFQMISKVDRMGMARPHVLPWKEVHADALIFLSDGNFATGRAGLGETNCPLHVIDSGKGSSKWLRARALRSGGGWHSSVGLDPLMGALDSKVSLVGEVLGKLIALREGSEGLETPIATWLWARLRSQEMRNLGVKGEELSAFNCHYGVMDSSSSMIVLETASQYQEFQITPPKEDEKLYQEWEKLQKISIVRQEGQMDQLAEFWKARCESLSAALS